MFTVLPTMVLTSNPEAWRLTGVWRLPARIPQISPEFPGREGPAGTSARMNTRPLRGGVEFMFCRRLERYCRLHSKLPLELLGQGWRVGSFMQSGKISRAASASACFSKRVSCPSAGAKLWQRQRLGLEQCLCGVAGYSPERSNLLLGRWNI